MVSHPMGLSQAVETGQICSSPGGTWSGDSKTARQDPGSGDVKSRPVWTHGERVQTGRLAVTEKRAVRGGARWAAVGYAGLAHQRRLRALRIWVMS